MISGQAASIIPATVSTPATGVATPFIPWVMRISENGNPHSNAQSNVNMGAAERHDFMVTENPALGRVLLAGNCTVRGMGLIITKTPTTAASTACRNAMTEHPAELRQESRGPMARSFKRTYPLVLGRDTDFFRSFFPAAASNSSQTQYACFPHYYKSTTSHPGLSPFCRTPLAPRQWPFFEESPYSVSLYSFHSTVVLPFKEMVWQDQPVSSSRHGFGCVSKVFLHPAHHNFYNIVVSHTRVPSI